MEDNEMEGILKTIDEILCKNVTIKIVTREYNREDDKTVTVTYTSKEMCVGDILDHLAYDKEEPTLWLDVDEGDFEKDWS